MTRKTTQKSNNTSPSAQSTPLRLFYAVGLEENLILRDPDGNQTGVDFTKISPEYISAHTVGEQNYVWFISNYYSNTSYTEYVTDTVTSRTRGDPTVTFSPNSENRYYVFQKSLPLYAHAYRNTTDGLRPVDNETLWRKWENGQVGVGEWSWVEDYPNGAGNGKTQWENDSNAGTWAGGEYMGTYKDGSTFETKKAEALAKNADAKGNRYITDDHGNTYLYVSDGIIFLEADVLDHVTSNPDTETGESGGYKEGSISFNSEDYYFLLVEYYLPDVNTQGVDEEGKIVPGSFGGRMVQRVVARRGSEFGSGFASAQIDNSDMLCWTDMDGKITLEMEYLSKSETGDLTRGEPTFEKLTYNEEGQLRAYFEETCGIDPEKTMPNPDYDPEDASKGEATVNVIDYLVAYWLKVQTDPKVQAALNEARVKAGTTGLTADNFGEYFQFAVSARTGGIRSGDMSNNRHAKTDNVTGTAQNYYVPTVSENSATDDGVILNTYLGNNGYLEIANEAIHITKMLEAPDGFTLSKVAYEEEFNFQVYVQGVSGKRSAILTQYNEFSKSWDRQLAYIDVLTDNSDLVVDNDSNRALFIATVIDGTGGTKVPTAKQVIAQTNEDGDPVYYEANEDGTLPLGEDGSVDETKRVEITDENPLYYLYLPSNGTSETAKHTRRLYQNGRYDGEADGYPENYDFKSNGTTTFYEEGQREEGDTGTDPDMGNNDSYRKTDDSGKRPTGTITYWAQDAELIPMEEVLEAETVDSVMNGEPSAYAAEAADPTPGVWTHREEDHDDHVCLTFFTLVIRRPSDRTSMTAFESPFKTRTQYMTVELVFGQNANADGSVDRTGAMTAGDLYDQIIPSADRPDLFGKVKDSDGSEKPIDNDYIAAHTAEFTLKHGEGLLLSGLGNRITYRFTEKLTEEQMAKGYTLKRISHIQQVGSESVYLPGVQEIPIYTKEGATYGKAYGDAASGYETENGLTWSTDPDATVTNEPLAHTNAMMWEYYATMAAGASGNHHQPAEGTVTAEVEGSVTVWDGKTPNTYTTVGGPHTVQDNPNCHDASSVDELAVGKCDLPQADGTTMHYMYYKGQLLDPHYEGEASGFLRNMGRYGVSPTVHFGVNGESEMGNVLTSVPSTILQSQTSGDTEYYDYNGVYSVYGNTGWFEEQVNYINTISPEMLVVTKQIVDETGAVMESAPDKEFNFTLTLTDTSGTAISPADNTVYLWKGSKDVTESGLTWQDAEGNSYSMPQTAPNLDEYQEYTDATAENECLQPLPLTLNEENGTYSCTFKLKANEAAVIYGLAAGTKYTVTEEMAPNYPISDTVAVSDPYTKVGEYTHDEKTVAHYAATDPGDRNRVAMRPSETSNRNNFYNQINIGSLTVKKYIHDDDRETVDKEFTFTVTLTPTDGSELVADDLTAAKYGTNDAKTEDFSLNWEKTEDGKGVTAAFRLKHGERVVIDGIPYNTAYKVAETDPAGYNLEHVADNLDDSIDEEGQLLAIDRSDNSVSGTVTKEHKTVYLLFNNAKPPVVPFTGGIGRDMFLTVGAVFLLASGVMLVNLYRKRRIRAK